MDPHLLQKMEPLQILRQWEGSVLWRPILTGPIGIGLVVIGVGCMELRRSLLSAFFPSLSLWKCSSFCKAFGSDSVFGFVDGVFVPYNPISPRTPKSCLGLSCHRLGRQRAVETGAAACLYGFIRVQRGLQDPIENPEKKNPDCVFSSKLVWGVLSKGF